MKIAEIKDGSEYGALDSPTSTSRYASQTPRRVVVVGREKIDKKRYGRWGTSGTTVKETVLTVEFVDEPTPRARSWDSITQAKKGSKVVIKPRQLVGLWSDLHPGILKRHAEEREREEYQEALNKRLKGLFGRKEAPYVGVSTYDGKPQASLHLDDDQLNLLLDYAEQGKVV